VQRQSFDADYVQRLTISDSETVRDFVEYFTELLSAKLRSRLHSAHRIQDVIQETFLRVMKTLRASGMENPQALGGFVNSVCNNVLFEVYRAEWRFTDPVPEGPGAGILTEDALLDEEARREVRTVMDELPDKDREILRLLFFEEWDKDAVCRALSVDREYLRVLVHRAKSRFREKYLKRNATKVRSASPMR